MSSYRDVLTPSSLALLQLIARIPLEIVRHGNHGQDAYDRDRDHHFDQGKARLRAGNDSS